MLFMFHQILIKSFGSSRGKRGEKATIKFDRFDPLLLLLLPGRSGQEREDRHSDVESVWSPINGKQTRFVFLGVIGWAPLDHSLPPFAFDSCTYIRTPLSRVVNKHSSHLSRQINLDNKTVTKIAYNARYSHSRQSILPVFTLLYLVTPRKVHPSKQQQSPANY